MFNMRKTDTISVVLGAGSVAAANALAQLFNGLTLIAAARRLPTDVFGEFASLYGLSLTLSVLLDFGSSQRVSRSLSLGSSVGFVRWVVTRTTLQALLLGSIAIVVAKGDYFAMSTGATSFLLAQSLTLSLSLAFTGALRALRSAAWGAWFLAVGNILPLAVSLTAPSQSLSSSLAAALSVSWIVTCLLSAAALPWHISGLAGRPACNPWHDSFGLGVFALAASASSLAVPLIRLTANAAEAGSLAAVARWVQPAVLFETSYCLYISPMLITAPTAADALRLVRQSRHVTIANVVLLVALSALSFPLVTEILGERYRGSTSVLALLSLATVPAVASQPTAVFLQARRHDAFVARAAVGFATTSLALVLLLGSLAGAKSMPLASGLAGLVYWWRLARKGRLVVASDSASATTS